jgi:hypothetical protein
MIQSTDIKAMNKKELLAHYDITWPTWHNWVNKLPEELKAIIKPGQQVFTPNEVRILMLHWG